MSAFEEEEEVNNEGTYLYQLFYKRSISIQAKLDQGDEPPVAGSEIILNIVKELTSKAGIDLRRRNDKHLSTLVKICFQTIHWNVMTNSMMEDDDDNDNAISMEALVSFMKDTSDQINDYDLSLQAGGDNLIPTEDELNDLSLAASKLWTLDFNRLIPGDGDYDIDLQQGKCFGQHGDVCSDPLFAMVNHRKLLGKTYQSFLKLLDNYSAETGEQETVTREEMHENRTFINAIFETPCIQYLFQYLCAKGKIMNNDETECKKFLYKIWFELYRRETHNDSSGFEHVFVGEIKNNAVTGFHNWLALYLEEKKGHLDYQGYIKPRRRRGRGYSRTEEEEETPDDWEQLITINLIWKGVEKKCSSVLVGVSPEFEIALYTLCFVCGEESNFVEIGPYDVIIQCYKYQSKGETYIGTSFPKAA